jgi:hypothetical protein
VLVSTVSSHRRACIEQRGEESITGDTLDINGCNEIHADGKECMRRIQLSFLELTAWAVSINQNVRHSFFVQSHIVVHHTVHNTTPKGLRESPSDFVNSPRDPTLRTSTRTPFSNFVTDRTKVHQLARPPVERPKEPTPSVFGATHSFPSWRNLAADAFWNLTLRNLPFRLRGIVVIDVFIRTQWGLVPGRGAHARVSTWFMAPTPGE